MTHPPPPRPRSATQSPSVAVAFPLGSVALPIGGGQFQVLCFFQEERTGWSWREHQPYRRRGQGGLLCSADDYQLVVREDGGGNGVEEGLGSSHGGIGGGRDDGNGGAEPRAVQIWHGSDRTWLFLAQGRVPSWIHGGPASLNPENTTATIDDRWLTTSRFDLLQTPFCSCLLKLVSLVSWSPVSFGSVVCKWLLGELVSFCTTAY
ncbi:hypothetical protein GQ55_8G242700 [Panicum hallii var. hallii]|uniref:Uncharacterized protein n=1 Tax=Panicum hallii var. hallii TaxID=1504633 RepID=A0A2T7CQQ4_9POAL|nr:hypothetical protein GQ55_8G242700 [Panicum hallii var. hallii]